MYLKKIYLIDNLCPKIKTTSSNKKRKSKATTQSSKTPLLSALSSTASSIVRKRASRTHSLVALADVAADVVVTAADLAVDSSLVLGAADALEVGGLGLLAGDGVDVAALGQGDLAVVAGALAADLDFGAGELLLDVLVNTGLLGCEENILVVVLTRLSL